MRKLLFRRKEKDRRKGGKAAVKIERVKGEPHGTHFDAVGDIETLQEYIMRRVSLENVVHMTQKPFAGRGKQFIAGHMVDLSEALSILVITVMLNKKPELATAYPIYWGGEGKSVRIEKIYEWPIQIEANVEVQVGDASVTYFAADFFMNRYMAGEIREARIWILGYMAQVNPYEGAKIKLKEQGVAKEIAMENAEVLLPYEKSGVLDDYIVSGRVKGMERFEILGKSFLNLRLSNIPLGEVDVIIQEERVRGEVRKGDMVEVVGWIEGMDSGTRWRTLRK